MAAFESLVSNVPEVGMREKTEEVVGDRDARVSRSALKITHGATSPQPWATSVHL